MDCLESHASTSTKAQVIRSSIKEPSFQLGWTDLSHSYSSGGKIDDRDGKKQVALQNCNGSVESATITAILGPSGAGKSTLLNCITGRIKPSSGRCYISAPANLIRDLKRSRIDYVQQKNEFFTLFTVKETLLFASRMNNLGMSREEHMRNIERLLEALDISDKIDWQLIKLSGGQMKRVAIACGLITRPAVIVLDEPTSGLDSDNAERLVMHLKSLVTSQHLALRPAVLLTIHSPSIGIFRMFDQVYILSRGGHNIYQGAPDLTISHFKSFGFTHARGNPAEWCIEVANGKFGVEKFQLMADQARAAVKRSANNSDRNNEIEVSAMKRQKASMFLQVWLLTWRSLIYYSMKMPQIEIRIIGNTICVLSYFWIQNDTIMYDSLCTDESTGIDPSFLADTGVLTTKVGGEFSKTYTTMARMVMLPSVFLMNIMGTSMVTAIMLATLHRAIYHREITNSWYTKKSFFISKFIADSIFRFSAVATCAFALYFVYGDLEWWRIAAYSFYVFLLATMWENIGTAVTFFFYNRQVIEVVGALVVLDFIDFMLIDWLAHRGVVNDYALAVKKFTPRCNVYGAMLTFLYGFGRCKTPAAEITAQASVPDFDSPREMVGYMWHVFNLSKEKMVNLLDLLYVDEEVSSGLYDRLSSWTLNATQVHQRHPSKVLQFFDYSESEVFHQTSVVLTWVAASLILYACAVSKRFRST